MFHLIVFYCLAVLLFLASAAALYMGVFEAHGNGRSQGAKALGLLAAGGISGVYWYLAYSFTYLGW